MCSSIMPKDYIKILTRYEQKLPCEQRFLSGKVFIALTKPFACFCPGRKQII